MEWNKKVWGTMEAFVSCNATVLRSQLDAGEYESKPSYTKLCEVCELCELYELCEPCESLNTNPNEYEPLSERGRSL